MLTKNKEEVNHKAFDRDEEVEKMLETWDIVKCRYCGKDISMLDAKIVNGEYFICKKGH